MADIEDDPIDDKPMPLLDHLMELRRRLMWSIAAFAVCFAGSYYFSSRIYYFLAEPLASVLREMGNPDPHLIYTQLYEAFFTPIKVAFFAGAFISFPIIATQMIGGQVVERARAAGVLSGDEASAWLQELCEAEEGGRFFCTLTGFIVVGR